MSVQGDEPSVQPDASNFLNSPMWIVVVQSILFTEERIYFQGPSHGTFRYHIVNKCVSYWTCLDIDYIIFSPLNRKAFKHQNGSRTQMFLNTFKKFIWDMRSISAMSRVVWHGLFLIIFSIWSSSTTAENFEPFINSTLSYDTFSINREDLFFLFVQCFFFSVNKDHRLTKSHLISLHIDF